MSKRSLSTQITRSKQMAGNMALMLLGFKDYDIEGIEDVCMIRLNIASSFSDIQWGYPCCMSRMWKSFI